MTKEQAEGYKVDRSGWPSGEWDSEPDRVEFRYLGFPCLLVRNRALGFWCGYVGVPSSHAAFEKHYDDVEANVHGGLTYADHCDGHICHVPAPGEVDNVWWLGFDCGHFLEDYAPGLRALPGMDRSPGIYRTAAYVTGETKRLAEQLRAKEIAEVPA